MTSIRRHLLKILFLALLLGTLVSAAFFYFSAMAEIKELYDSNMKQHAYLLQSQYEQSLPNSKLTNLRFGPSQRVRIKGEEDFLVQLWNSDGQPAYRSHQAITLPLQTQEGFSETQIDGLLWHIYVLRNEHSIIQISQPENARDALVREMAMNMLIPLAAQALILGIAIWLGVIRGIAPLAKISQALGIRSAASLEPIDATGMPAEVQPMMQALNALLARLDIALTAQRRFNADAAHELRTPLAALQLQLDNLKRSDDAAEIAATTQKLQQGIQRSAHLVQQLLTMAKLEPDVTPIEKTHVNLRSLILQCIEQHQPLAIARKVMLESGRLEDATIAADPFHLEILINNLIDNAIRYTQDGGAIEVSLHNVDNRIKLSVRDNGIGISPERQKHIFERFYRAAPAQSAGSGLGLAIVKSIAEQHNATISVQSTEGAGTSFTVEFLRAN